MSKAEERACQYTGYCRNQSYKDYLNGYHQAKKDNELTVDDIMKIDALLIEMWNQSGNKYQEVFKRFKDFKERKV